MKPSLLSSSPSCTTLLTCLQKISPCLYFSFNKCQLLNQSTLQYIHSADPLIQSNVQIPHSITLHHVPNTNMQIVAMLIMVLHFRCIFGPPGVSKRVYLCAQTTWWPHKINSTVWWTKAHTEMFKTLLRFPDIWKNSSQRLWRSVSSKH